MAQQLLINEIYFSIYNLTDDSQLNTCLYINTIKKLDSIFQDDNYKSALLQLLNPNNIEPDTDSDSSDSEGDSKYYYTDKIKKRKLPYIELIKTPCLIWETPEDKIRKRMKEVMGDLPSPENSDEENKDEEYSPNRFYEYTVKFVFETQNNNIRPRLQNFLHSLDQGFAPYTGQVSRQLADIVKKFKKWGLYGMVTRIVVDREDIPPNFNFKSKKAKRKSKKGKRTPKRKSKKAKSKRKIQTL
jgi:hypothetical protein